MNFIGIAAFFPKQNLGFTQFAGIQTRKYPAKGTKKSLPF